MRIAVVALLLALALQGATGHDAWLRYEPITETTVLEQYARLPATVVALGNEPTIQSAQQELIRGVRGMLGRVVRAEEAPGESDMIVLGTFESIESQLHIETGFTAVGGSYRILTTMRSRHRVTIVAGQNATGVLYGTFAFLRKIALHESVDPLDEQSTPYAPIRWVNQWDNLNGTIERGYAGRSIFFDNDNAVPDLSRAGEYGRLLASLGINGCTVNNVNANPRVLSPGFLPQLVRIADVFRPWGVRMSIAVDLGSPKTVGGLDTFDPLDARVQAWWKQRADEIYSVIPDFAGFVLKADSEGRVGPSTYGRTHADAANVLAAALKPHGGILIYRGFVYDHHMDWRNLKNDRARAAYDNFHPLDGSFAENAAVQIKYGPIDFQVREPVSPLIAGLQRTNETLELQITQEYTGQQRQLCYLVPMWKEILDFDMRAEDRSTAVKDLVSGRTFHRPLGGFVGVANVGRDDNWMGFDLAQANLYGFGRLAWNPNLSARAITDEWTKLTFGNDALVDDTIMNLELASWRVYESYTGTLGLQTLTDILHSHYQPNVAAAEHNGWGQWIRADEKGVGMDRSSATGTGYAGQYPPEVAKRYESAATTPESLLLFFHHEPYTYVLPSGETVIQSIYDSHYQGASEVQSFPAQWQQLRGRVDEQRFRAVLDRLEYQAGEAVVWRDSICNWFQRESGIADERKRVGHYPDRIEAETMRLTGYTPVDVTPTENASGGKAVVCVQTTQCSAAYEWRGAAGWRTIDVQYFDENTGVARFEVFVNQQRVDMWSADRQLPSATPNGDTSVRKRLLPVMLETGDLIRVVGTPEGADQAALDYIAIN